MDAEQCMESYKIIFKGRVVEGTDIVKIATLLAKFLKLPESKAEQLLNGKAYALKKNLNQEQAQQVHGKLSSVGIITDIVKEVSVSDAVSSQEVIKTDSSNVDFEILVDGKKCCKHCGSNLESQAVLVSESLHFVGDKLSNINTDAIKNKLKGKGIDLTNEITRLVDFNKVKGLLPSVLGVLFCLMLVILGYNFGAFGGDNDSPYPMSQDNLKVLAKKITSEINDYNKSPNDTAGKAIKDIYQVKLQEDLGFSLDKTIRSILLFGYGGKPALEVFKPVLEYVINNMDSALDEGIISNRTYELLSLPANNLGEKELEFLKYAIACQDDYDGVCASDGLIETIQDKNTSPEISKLFKKYKIGSGELRSELAYKFDFHIPKGNLITKPDGSKFNTNFIFDSNEPFIIDKVKMNEKLRASAILEEEKQSLFN